MYEERITLYCFVNKNMIVLHIYPNIRPSGIKSNKERISLVQVHTFWEEVHVHPKCSLIVLDPTRQSPIGASEIFNCENCGLTSDWVVHAARNILLKHLI